MYKVPSAHNLLGVSLLQRLPLHDMTPIAKAISPARHGMPLLSRLPRCLATLVDHEALSSWQCSCQQCDVVARSCSPHQGHHSRGAYLHGLGHLLTQHPECKALTPIPIVQMHASGRCDALAHCRHNALTVLQGAPDPAPVS